MIIATPVFTHCRRSPRAALEAGKHTFVEKPLATSSGEADELERLAAVQRRVLMCGQTFLYSPPVRAVKALIDEGKLGEIYLRLLEPREPGPAPARHQRDLGSRPARLLDPALLAGELPTTVRAIGRDSIVDGITDVAFVTMEFPSGVIANVELSWLAPSKLRRTVVVGSEKMVVYDDGASEPVRALRLTASSTGIRRPSASTTSPTGPATCVSPKLDSYEPLHAELVDFAHAIESGSAEADITNLSRDVVRVAEAAERSLLSGGTAIRVQRPGRFVPSMDGAPEAVISGEPEAVA